MVIMVMAGVMDAAAELGGNEGDQILDGIGETALHDVRLYNIALADEEVARIYTRNPDQQIAGDKFSAAEYRAKWADALQLEGLPDIEVETRQGQLPNLPWYLPGRYGKNSDGPRVRVIWPAPTNNVAVVETGKYTITGIVPGTELRPQAHVTVKPAGEKLKETRTLDGEKLARNAEVVVHAGFRDHGAAPRRNLYPFPLADVKLNPYPNGQATPFVKNRDKFINGLLAADPDSFLFMFRDAFGRPQPEDAEPLGVWDARTVKLRGHATGHYLTALAQGYAGAMENSDTQLEFGKKMDYMLDTLYDLARASGRPVEEGAPFNADPKTVPVGPGKTEYDSDLSPDGIRHDYWNWGEWFISAYPPDQFIMLEKGASYGGDASQVWAPYYTLDKILKGLLDCYEVSGNQKALQVAKGMGLWACERLKTLPPEKLAAMWNSYIAGEYGGMNTVMARLHALTGDERFVAGARIFDNTSFFYGGKDHQHGLACNVDTIRGRHANQHVPQIIGALYTYRATGDADYYRISENFWNHACHAYNYSIGGVAGARDPNNSECFTAQPDSLFAKGFNKGGQNETCATYNLLKLTRGLFMHNPDGHYMDYYEKAFYNHILASVAKETPANTYHVPLNPGARKTFSNAGMDGFTCCNGTALDSNTKLQDSIYFRNSDNTAVYANLYIPFTLEWEERDIVIRQKTRYPYGDTTKFVVGGSGRFALNLRVPGWTGEGAWIALNGEKLDMEMPAATYIGIERVWADGDTVEMRLPFDFRLERVVDRPDLASLFYGPVLLAVEESQPLENWRRVAIDIDDIASAVEGDPGKLRFHIDGLKLKPFFEFDTERHSVYLDVHPQ